jgi:hypothetical protein
VFCSSAVSSRGRPFISAAMAAREECREQAGLRRETSVTDASTQGKDNTRDETYNKNVRGHLGRGHIVMTSGEEHYRKSAKWLLMMICFLIVLFSIFKYLCLRVLPTSTASQRKIDFVIYYCVQLRPEACIKRKATRHDYLPSLLDDGDKRNEMVVGEAKYCSVDWAD